jgi:hypothetical protein
VPARRAALRCAPVWARRCIGRVARVGASVGARAASWLARRSVPMRRLLFGCFLVALAPRCAHPPTRIAGCGVARAAPPHAVATCPLR